MNEKNQGWAWHIHHNILCEWCYDFKRRVKVIKDTKPPNEIPTRLRLFRFVENVPVGLQGADAAWQKAVGAWQKAYAAWWKADAAWQEADAARQKAEAAWRKADTARRKAYEDALPALEALHAKECGCKEWNGKELVFPPRMEKEEEVHGGLDDSDQT